MSVNFYFGKASCDHHHFLIDRLAQKSRVDPQGHFFYLVPNHIKFAAEVKVLKQLRQTSGNQGLYAQKNVQTFSFTRLAWYFLKDTPIFKIPRLSKAGNQMLVAAILQDKQAELTIFKANQVQIGFVSQLAAQLSELQQNLVTTAELTQLAKSPLSANLQAKLHDLTLVYQEYQQKSQQQFIGNEGVLNLLAENLQQRDLSHDYFYIAGFSHFNQQERQLVEVLIKKAAEVNLALVGDRESFLTKQDPNSLFYRSSCLYQALARSQASVKLLPITNAPKTESTSLLNLEDYWIRNSRLEFVPTSAAQSTDSLQLFKAADRQTEVRQVAIKIRQLLQQEQGHYRDFVVMTRHLDLYRNIIEPIFQQAGIPFFIDLQHEMSSHPLVELISALFDIQANHYQYDDVMRLLKTELLLPQTATGQPLDLGEFRDCLDLTENWILKTGLNGSAWLQSADWQVFRFETTDTDQVLTSQQEKQTQQVNLIRHFVQATLPPFFEKLMQAHTGRQAAEILVNFLVETGVARQLLTWRDQAIAAGDLAAASRPEEVWNTFVQMLDEYVLIFGDRPVELELFKELLLNGFAGAQYSQVPSTLDQVTITETGMAQLQNAQTAFLIGATSAVMPDQTTQPALLSDSDRLQLADYLPLEQADLAQTSNIQLASESYLAYLAFMLPKKRLVLSYPQQESDGQELKASPYLKQLAAQFALDCPLIAAEPPAGISVTDFGRFFVGNSRTTLSQLLNLARKNQKQLPLSFQPLAKWLKQDPQVGQLAKRVFASLSYRNVPEKLQPKIVDGLYGKTINTSISKLEEFYTNQYAYFLKYGLRLQERDVFELSPANTGEFFHAALDHLHRNLAAQHTSIAEISSQQLQQQIRSITQELLRLPQFQILNSSNRMQYLSRQLAKTIRQVSWTIHQQLQRSQVRPFKTEVLFGQVGSQEGLRPLEFQLSQQHAVRVRGKIDRIDLLQKDQQTYLGIVDYKSSQHKFNFRDAYYGVSLQMLTYLDALIKNFDLLLPKMQPDPAGAVYLHLQDPKLDLKDVLQTPFEQAWLKKNKYEGLLLAEPELLELLDQELTQDKSGVSLVYPFRRRKDGSYAATGKNDPQLITKNQLKLLLWHNELLIQQAAAKIFSGDLAIDPVLWPDKRSAMQYSPFKAIMQFDAMLAENNYHQLSKMSAAEVLEKIQAERSK
ncbi:PD-(D/E)XK nuclease family protein [Liquorilactobacillus vini]|uniref:ATP-dependent helicase/deoxyribonuclease subunit B n=3 Tax=Liquorilactobacillus vini TaxID=238015 RepID=A0A0R2CM41_9LACO|nr:PD-(D/E)XK nuclease family protein [Liquorilactobacillus vini]KRM89372.1 atp-dependent deoxyribonuclease, subunit b [Liquorilactobacillus vini DSM 20605]